MSIRKLKQRNSGLVSLLAFSFIYRPEAANDSIFRNMAYMSDLRQRRGRERAIKVTKGQTELWLRTNPNKKQEGRAELGNFSVQSQGIQ
jgi:hypothetical protein